MILLYTIPHLAGTPCHLAGTADDALKHVFVGQSAYQPPFCGDDIDWGIGGNTTSEMSNIVLQIKKVRGAINGSPGFKSKKVGTR